MIYDLEELYRILFLNGRMGYHHWDISRKHLPGNLSLTKLYLQIVVQKSVICEYSFSLNLCLTHLQFIVISLKTLVTHLLKYICLPPCCTFLGQKYSARSRVPLYCPDNLIFCKCSVLKISNICNVLI